MRNRTDRRLIVLGIANDHADNVWILFYSENNCKRRPAQEDKNFFLWVLRIDDKKCSEGKHTASSHFSLE